MPFARALKSSSIVALALAVAAASGVARGADGPTVSSAKTAADVQALIDAKNYNGAVSAAGHLVLVTGAAAADVDKAQVYALKGDAHVHLKQFPQASDAYARAAKAATDPAVVATDTATALLLRRSPTGTYKPKQPAADGTKPAPVDLTQTEDRKPALGYLFADEFAAAGSRLTAAKTATTVPQLLQAAELANGLRQLELAATGADEKTRPEVTAVAEHAHGLVETNLRTMSARVVAIREAANTTTTQYVQQRTAAGSVVAVPERIKAGLTSANGSELRGIQGTCQKIAPAADAFAKASAEGGGAGGSAGWDALSADAGRVAAAAGDVLNADYGTGTVRRLR